MTSTALMFPRLKTLSSGTKSQALLLSCQVAAETSLAGEASCARGELGALCTPYLPKVIPERSWCWQIRWLGGVCRSLVHLKT